MATRSSKRALILDLTGDDEDSLHADGDLDAPRPKRRRKSTKRVHVEDEAQVEGLVGLGHISLEAAGPSIETEKPARGRKKNKAPEAEKRTDEYGATVTFRPKASQDVKARIQRAMPGSAHRMFLVDTKQLAPPGVQGGPAQEFQVLGATGNVYTVGISRHPSCTCPDFAKGHLCKHILFVMLRVLRQSPANPLIWQRALLTTEVEEVLAPVTRVAAGAAAAGPSGAAGGSTPGQLDQSVLASERVRQRYAAIVGAASSGSVPGGNGVQRPVEGDCPICYEAMGASGSDGDDNGCDGEAIVFCHSCGNNMHKQCFKTWADTKRKRGEGVTCVYCRAAWATGGAAAAGTSTPGGSEYINLSQYSDAHRSEPSLEELYGGNSYFILAHSGQMDMRQAVRMHAASQGWS